MINKLYKKIKKIMIDNHNYILFLVFLALFLNIRFPYYINRPGGTISLNKRIKVDGKYINNNYASSYVTVNDATLMSILMSYVFPNWDLERTSNDYSSKELNHIETLEIENSNLVAKTYALKAANIPYEEVNSKVMVVDSVKEYKNGLKSGDEIYKCDDIDVLSINDLNECTKLSDNNDVLLKIRRNNKDKTLNVKLNPYQDKNIIGISVYRDYEIKSEPNVTISHSKDELGPSGGFMTALALYDALLDKGYSKNIKISGTGTINEYGEVGEIGAIKYKLLGADKDNVKIFFVPDANYQEALDIYNKYHLKLKLVKVIHFEDAINYLENMN